MATQNPFNARLRRSHAEKSNVQKTVGRFGMNKEGSDWHFCWSQPCFRSAPGRIRTCAQGAGGYGACRWAQGAELGARPLGEPRRGQPSPEVLRRALRSYVLPPPRREREQPADVVAAVQRIEKASLRSR